jgi:potassium-dependent mechanosensitive channel
MRWLDAHGLEIGGARVPYAALLVALLIIIFGFFLASRLSGKIRNVGTLQVPPPRWRTTLAQVAGHALRLMTLAVALQVAGVNIATVLAAGAVVAVGVGIAMQKVAENFVSGIILYAERSIREGDIIEFDDQIAKVRHIGIRATIAVTLDDQEIIVPNSILAQTAVKNLTLTEPVYRLRVRVSVAYSTDVDRAVEVLGSAADNIPWREQDHAPVVLLLEFGASSIDFEVSVWTRDVWGLRRGQSDLRKALWRALRDASITIPFPQLDVHFDASADGARRQGLGATLEHAPSFRKETTMERFDPEAVDLANLASMLKEAAGRSVVGAVVGRTRLRDEVVRHLQCSQLEGEQIVDTMVARGFLLQQKTSDGQVYWTIKEQ